MFRCSDKRISTYTNNPYIYPILSGKIAGCQRRDLFDGRYDAENQSDRFVSGKEGDNGQDKIIQNPLKLMMAFRWVLYICGGETGIDRLLVYLALMLGKEIKK